VTVDLHARLLAQLDNTPQGRALAAVLNRHDPLSPTIHGDETICFACSDDRQQVWPCQTVLDIARELNVAMT